MFNASLRTEKEHCTKMEVLKMQMKKIKENAAFFIGIIVNIGMFVGMVLIELSFIYRGDISVYFVIPISVFIGWLAGFVAYMIISLLIPGTDEGWEYPFPKISLFNHS